MKKVFALMMAAIMLISCLALAACSSTRASSAAIGKKTAGEPIRYGDANGDGSADMKDVLIIRRYIAGEPIMIDLAAADINRDGSVDMKDVLKLRRCIANMDEWPTDELPDESSDGSAESQETSPLNPSTPSEEPGESEGSLDPDASDVSETTLPPRTSTVRSTTQSTYHEPIDFSGDPQIDFISGTETMGVWWWNLADGMKLDTREKYLDYLKYNHVSEIYYYCYDAITTPNRRSEVHEFVQSAMTRGMRVSFMYDDPMSIKEDNTYVTDKLVPNYLAYKEEYPLDAVYGLHLDVEPKRNQLQDYVDNFLVAEIAPAREQGVFIELDVNINYGSVNLSYNGESQNFYDIVAQNCDTISLMAYRTRSDRIISQTEAPRASAKKYNKKLIFGIELGDSGEGVGVDFSRSSKTVAYGVLREVDAALAEMDLPAGYGYAIHHMRAWFNLKNE
ncbi:MAG: dockerin type I repeat-containing protein [Clostridia bacterium]|nr:dockerin type I repeat-containing protein [Clostridia bacterium]